MKDIATTCNLSDSFLVVQKLRAESYLLIEEVSNVYKHSLLIAFQFTIMFNHSLQAGERTRQTLLRIMSRLLV